jgi:hypothetical protein
VSKAPHTPSHVIQAALQERYSILVSVGHLTRVQAELGVGSRTPTGKKTAVPWLFRGSALARSGRWTPPGSSGAGNRSAFYLGHRPVFVPARGELALRPPLFRLPSDAGADAALFGSRRTWILRGYTVDALALLSGRNRAYGYFHTERLLSQLTQANGAEPLTDALAAWTALLWRMPEQEHFSQSAAFYIDGHRKPVYSEALILRGLVGRLSTILRCQALILKMREVLSFLSS